MRDKNRLAGKHRRKHWSAAHIPNHEVLIQVERLAKFTHYGPKNRRLLQIQNVWSNYSQSSRCLLWTQSVLHVILAEPMFNSGVFGDIQAPYMKEESYKVKCMALQHNTELCQRCSPWNKLAFRVIFDGADEKWSKIDWSNDSKSNEGNGLTVNVSPHAKVKVSRTSFFIYSVFQSWRSWRRSWAQKFGSR